LFGDERDGVRLEQRIARMARHFQAVADIAGGFLR
jgi:hypothetical protein